AGLRGDRPARDLLHRPLGEDRGQGHRAGDLRPALRRGRVSPAGEDEVTAAVAGQAPSTRVRLPAVVLAGALLAVGVVLAVMAVRPTGGPGTIQDRVRAVGATLRCPVCQDLSVAGSPSPI